MPTTTPTNPGWRVQLAIHRAVRRDANRLAIALADGGVPNEAVRAYWASTAAQLHHHHEFEDTVVWPLMGERLGDRVAALLTRNAHEHEVMASAMDEFDAALDTSDATRARVALGGMQEVIETHLAHEEADVLPLIPEAFTLEDITFFQAEDAKTNAPSAFLPWMLDDAPDEDLAFFTGHMPPSVREQLDSEWTPNWRKSLEALRVEDRLASR
ncbi:MAG: hemerythrin domain-containing protein [Acidimicrobiales bacterium]